MYDAVSRNVNRTLLFFSGGVTFFLVFWLLRNAGRGIDFTDESFYLVSMASPHLYDWAVTNFGYFYHPFYELLGGDISWLRRFNIVTIFGLSWLLSYFVMQFFILTPSSYKFSSVIVSAGFATSSLVFFSLWIPTPSYNGLTLQALLVTCLGLLMVCKGTLNKFFSGIWVGIGGWMAFMAKPSAALALGLAVTVFLLVARKFSLLVVLGALTSAVGLLLVSALLISGSILGFIQRLQLGILFGEYLDGGHTLDNAFRFDEFVLLDAERWAIWGLALVCGVTVFLSSSTKRIFNVLALMITIVFFMVMIVICFNGLSFFDFSFFQGLLIWGLVYACILVRILFCFSAEQVVNQKEVWALFLLFLIMPYVYAFGSNGNYWWVGGFAAFFWILSGVTLLVPIAKLRSSWTFILPLVLAVQAMTILFLQRGFEQPYRQFQSLTLNDRTVEFGASGSELVLSQGYADYVLKATKAATQAGFSERTPVIDLTGHSPGILYALHAVNIGQAWTIGGYPGSLKLAEKALDRVSCELVASAWLLVEPEGPRSISSEVVGFFGTDFSEGYMQVASWKTAKGVGGYSQEREQVLYKPLDPENALHSCRQRRRLAE